MSQTHDIDIDYAAFLEPTARIFLGAPNRALSSKHELRYGRNGSLSLNLKTGQWFDHETKEGGGTLDFIKYHIGCTDRRDATEWLEKQGLKKANGGAGRRGNGGDIEYDAARNHFKGFQPKKKRTAPFRIVKTWKYVDENSVDLFEVCRLENGEIGADGKPQKTYRQRHKTSQGYVNSVKGIRQVPYRLAALIEAIPRGETVFIVEGEPCADAIVAIGGVATCNAMGAGKWSDELTPFFQGADLVILPDNDKPGAKHGELVAEKLQGVAKRIRILELPGLPPKGDVADWIAAGGTREKLLQLAESAPEYSGEADNKQPELTDVDFEAEVRRIAALSNIRYERERVASASWLRIPVSSLDRLVKDERKGNEPQTQGRPIEFPEPEPWLEPVNGAALLDEIETTFSRFIVCGSAARAGLALWSCATWFEPIAQVAAVLNVTSPEMRCGKSVALPIIGKLAKRSLTSASISPAAVFRTIEKHVPTLLTDEADAFLGENEELRGLINSGHTRETAFVVRTVGDNHEPKQFSTWGFKAIAGIGKRASTIQDRAITIALKRKLPSEKVERLRHAEPRLFETLARKLARFAADSMAKIAEARPELPEALNDRAQDNWEPLLAIADVAGGPWPQKAREAALALSGTKDEPASLGEELLRDIRNVFTEKAVERIAGADLVTALVAKDERPWGEANRGKPVTQAWLARRLNQFTQKISGSGARFLKATHAKCSKTRSRATHLPRKVLHRYTIMKSTT
jgi:Protein of unknown function (DUF3631)